MRQPTLSSQNKGGESKSLGGVWSSRTRYLSRDRRQEGASSPPPWSRLPDIYIGRRAYRLQNERWSDCIPQVLREACFRRVPPVCETGRHRRPCWRTQSWLSSS